jgi:CubicO group peptidase (beta-lactamase class C family)/DNA-binding transcriptional regulator PaaX
MTYFHHSIVDSPLLPRGLDHDTAQSAIVNLLGELLPYQTVALVPSAAIVDVLRQGEVSEAAARAALSRLGRRGTVTGLKSGRTTSYRLSDHVRDSIPRSQHLTMSFGGQERAWDGNWTMVVYSLPEAERALRSDIRDWLRWLGFGSVRDGVWIAPHAPVDLVLASLDDLLPPDGMIFRSEQIRGEIEPDRAWPLKELQLSYATFAEEFGPSLEALQNGLMPPADALRTLLRLVGRWRGFPTVDPDLPWAMLPDRWSRSTARDVFVGTYDLAAPLAAGHFREIVARYDDVQAKAVRALSVAGWLDELSRSDQLEQPARLDLAPRRRSSASAGRRTGSAPVEGEVASGFEAVREAFAEGQSLEPGGAQLCVYRGGEKVVDLWTGRDLVDGKPFDADSLVVLMSNTKAITGLCIAILAERGLLAFDSPIADHWPAFGVNGKEAITIAQVLTHTSGLAFFPDPTLAIDVLTDWDACVRLIEESSPCWEPGTAVCYHPITYGFILGEVVRRVSGIPIDRFIADEISTPLAADLYLGLPPEFGARRVRTFVPSGDPWPPGSVDPSTARRTPAQQRLDEALRVDLDFTGRIFGLLNASEGVRAVLPASNAVGTARAMARILAATIGPVDGHRIVSEDMMQRVRSPRTFGVPFVFSPGSAPEASGGYGLGFELGGHPDIPMLGAGSFGYTGAGGILSYADPDTRVAVSFVSTNMRFNVGGWPDRRWRWNAALAEVLGVDA